MSPHRTHPWLRLAGKLAVGAVVAALSQLPTTAHAAILAPRADADPSVTTSLGSDFWLAFPQNIDAGALSFSISGAAAGSGTVSVPGHDWSQDFTVTPGQVTNVALPSEVQVTSADGVSNDGIHITASTDVAVYGVNFIPSTSGAYLGLPTAALGDRYRILAYNPLAGELPSQLTVVGTQDGTTVTVTPQNDLGSHPAGVPYTVNLDQGQVYQLADNNTDTTGTVIESTAPVAVFGGDQCTDVPSDAYACDHLVQQLPPTSAWGTDFLSVRFASRNAGDTYRVLANEDNTDVSVNGSLVDTLDAGQYWEGVLPDAATGTGSEGFEIQTSKPTLVAQYGNGSDFDASTGDPMMMLVPPAGQYLDSYTVAAPDTGYSPYASLVVPTDDVGAVTLDGNTVPAEDFNAIGGSGYSGAQLTLSAGTHSFNGPHPFGLNIYEWGDYDGFGFPGGMAMKKIYIDPQAPLTADNLTSSATAPAAQHTTVPVPEGGSVTLLDGEGTAVTQVTLDGIGTYALDADTGVITFTPVAGYSGTPDPVTYQLTKDTQSATATYTPTVNAPAAPSTRTLTSTGAGTQPQSVTVDLPEGDTITLLDAEDNPTDQIVVDGVGTYVLDPATGTITFVAAAGYTGTPDGVTYQITDIYAQTSTDTYTPTVTMPAPPTARPKHSSGPVGDVQSITVNVPTGGSASLLDSDGNPTDTIVVPGEGTYTIDPSTGVITFTPDPDFTGKASGVSYQVTDGYGQSVDSTYQPTVKTGSNPNPGPPAKLRLTAPALVKLGSHDPGHLSAHCKVMHRAASVCKVELTARVNGDITAIGHGHGKAPQGSKHFAVTVQLTKLGKALAARPGGVQGTVRAQARVVGGSHWVRATGATRVVDRVTQVPRAVHFGTSSAALRSGDKAYLAKMRHSLNGVRVVVCAGYTDSAGSGKANKKLGLERARNTCQFLTKGIDVKTTSVSHGEARPVAPNSSAYGRALNRRAEITLKY